MDHIESAELSSVEKGQVSESIRVVDRRLSIVDDSKQTIEDFYWAYELAGMHSRFLPVWLPFVYDLSSKRLLKRIALLLEFNGDTSELMVQAKGDK